MKEVGNKIVEGIVYGNFGVDYFCFGDVDKVIYNYEFFFKFKKEMGDRNGEVKVYNFFGVDYLSCGDFEKVMYYYLMSLDICK